MITVFRNVLRACACLLLCVGVPALVLASEPKFERDVKPILAAHCFKCHGLEASQAGLDLRTRSLMVRGGDNGPVLNPNDLMGSLLYKQIVSRNMPPDGELDLTDAQVEIIRRWVEAGAPAGKGNDSELGSDAPLVSDKDRQFWAFQKLRSVRVPAVARARQVTTPIDALLLAKLAAVGHGLEFSPPADRVTLIRRAQLDLIGLPPEPVEIERFVSDPSPDAYERLLDRLLASPHFGERWGRHWMDAAGYSEVRGTDFDAAMNRDKDFMAGMWRYREYVIQSYNNDKPFDRFVTEQVAGDELVDWRNQERLSTQDEELLVATSFLRMAVDLTWDPPDNTAYTRFAVLHQTLASVSSNLLGLSLRCAKCHTHKFDPIPQRDYYRMLALLTPAFNPQSWLLPGERDVSRGGTSIHAVYDVGPPPETYLLRRGDQTQPLREVRPGFLAVLCDNEKDALRLAAEPIGETSGRRLALARWLTNKDGRAAALMTRVQVNRVWQHLFGVGLVSTADNFGYQGAKPTHPDLLDWLAVEYIDNGWRLKPLLKRIMSSTVYRQASEPREIGPGSRFPSRMPVRRLSSEVLRDAMLACSGQIDRQIGGPSINTDARPDGRVVVTKEDQPTPTSPWRRSVYVLSRRRWFPTIMSVFDQPNMDDHCTRRESSTIVHQALTMLNDQFVMERADGFARRVLREAGSKTEDQIVLAFRIALARRPTTSELQSSKQLLARQAERFRKAGAGADEIDQKSLACVCHVLYNTSEFLYVD